MRVGTDLTRSLNQHAANPLFLPERIDGIGADELTGLLCALEQNALEGNLSSCEDLLVQAELEFEKARLYLAARISGSD